MPPRIGKSLSKLVASSGALSRRLAEQAVIGGRVAVDGTVCRKPATRIELSEQEVTLDGTALGPPIEQVDSAIRLWRYHKPRGLVTTHSDPAGRPTVFGSLPSSLPRVISVGRLDAESEGLLLLTTLGSLARSLELPSSAIKRAYHCLVQTGQREIGAPILDELRSGLTLADGTWLRPMQADPVPDSSERRGRRWVRMVLTEGKNREIRRVWEHYGFATLALVRVGYGPFELGSLPPGQVEEVCASEVRALRRKAHSWSNEQGRS